MPSVEKNIQEINLTIRSVLESNGREVESARLIAVSKKQSVGRIEEALKAGQRVFGENRVQEAYQYWETRRSQYQDVELHLIGPLQTNKVKEAVALFDVIQTLDRAKLAKVLKKEMDKQNKTLPCFIQVNTGEEEQKSGILPNEFAEFYRFCTEECALDVAGLMCIPPAQEPPALHFALLRQLADSAELQELSMGMSHDYERALALGATYVRIGTGVFGAREKG